MRSDAENLVPDTNVAKLPFAIHQQDMSTSDRLIRMAMDNGWETKRRSANYFVAVRTDDTSRREQVAVWVRNGAVVASRALVIDEAEAACEVEEWLAPR